MTVSTHRKAASSERAWKSNRSMYSRSAAALTRPLCGPFSSAIRTINPTKGRQANETHAEPSHSAIFLLSRNPSSSSHALSASLPALSRTSPSLSASSAAASAALLLAPPLPVVVVRDASEVNDPVLLESEALSLAAAGDASGGVIPTMDPRGPFERLLSVLLALLGSERGIAGRVGGGPGRGFAPVPEGAVESGSESRRAGAVTGTAAGPAATSVDSRECADSLMVERPSPTVPCPSSVDDEAELRLADPRARDAPPPGPMVTADETDPLRDEGVRRISGVSGLLGERGERGATGEKDGMGGRVVTGRLAAREGTRGGSSLVVVGTEARRVSSPAAPDGGADSSDAPRFSCGLDWLAMVELAPRLELGVSVPPPAAVPSTPSPPRRQRLSSRRSWSSSVRVPDRPARAPVPAAASVPDPALSTSWTSRLSELKLTLRRRCPRAVDVCDAADRTDWFEVSRASGTETPGSGEGMSAGEGRRGRSRRLTRGLRGAGDWREVEVVKEAEVTDRGGE